MNKIIALLFAVLFIGFEFMFLDQLDRISPYTSYGFEVVWVVAIIYFLKGFHWFNRGKLVRGTSVLMITALMGAAARFAAAPLGVPVPFDFSSTETLLFLLLVGPVLEEFVFRYGLWRVIEVFTAQKWVPLLLTSLLFSYFHYRSIDLVPSEIQDFVKYQAVYTLVLGGLCGWLRLGYGLSLALLAHLLFNFGFWWFGL